MNQITMTANQKKTLERKAKVGWACFYRTEELNNNLHMEHLHMLRAMKSKIEERDAQLYEKAQIPTFITDELTSLIGELKKEIECPICYEELKSDDIKFSSCGHKYCETCLSKIKECAICRRKLYHK